MKKNFNPLIMEKKFVSNEDKHCEQSGTEFTKYKKRSSNKKGYDY